MCHEAACGGREGKHAVTKFRRTVSIRIVIEDRKIGNNTERYKRMKTERKRWEVDGAESI